MLAVAISGDDFLLLIRSEHMQRQALYVGGRNRYRFRRLRFNPNYSQIVGNWIMIRYLLHIPPKPGRPRMR